MAQNLPIRGADRIILMRPYSLRHEEAAGRLAFQTSHEKTLAREATATVTKDGNIQSLGELTVEMSLTTLLASNDKVRFAMHEAFLNGELVEFWDVGATRFSISA